MTIFLGSDLGLFQPILLVALALGGVGPSAFRPEIAWTAQTSASSLSVSPAGVFVASHDKLSRLGFDGKTLWTREINSTTSEESALAIAAEPTAVYVGGTIGGGSCFGRNGGCPVQGYCDAYCEPAQCGPREYCSGTAFLQKYDVDGRLLWRQQFEPLGGRVAAIAVFGGAIYVAGNKGARQQAWFNSEIGCCGPTLPFLAKYDDKGTQIWETIIWSPYELGIDYVTGISANSQAIYVSGEGLSEERACESPSMCAWGAIYSFDHNGKKLWVQMVVTQRICDCLPPSSFALGVSADNQGVFGVGFQSHFNGSLNGPFVRRYDLNGTLLWTRRLVDANAVSVGPSGIYVVGGTTLTSLDFQGSENWSLSLSGPDVTASTSLDTVLASPRGLFVGAVDGSGGGFVDRILLHSH